MWILESSGKSFGGRKLWLKPGKQYLLGRTDGQSGELAIAHKTVSRKHLMVEVGEVQEGEAQNLAGRSKLTVEDLKSSKGSVLDGGKLEGKQIIMTPSCEFRLGSNPEIFTITWTPVVLIFASISKSPSQANPLSTLRATLEPLDIKFTTSYVPQTTHVISRKRNVPKALQALINGKFLVTPAFVAALAQAAEQRGDDGQCLLEKDFETGWPREAEFVPPKGQEAVDREVGAFLPRVERKGVFRGYTFVFVQEAQYKNLLGPITDGGGKAVYHPVTPYETTTEQFLRFVKDTACEEGMGEFADACQGPGVVLVRYTPAEGLDVPWWIQFIQEVSMLLNHRQMEQSEFIEAILANDASILRRQLPENEQATKSRGNKGKAPVGGVLVSRPASTENTQVAETQDRGSSASSRPRGRKPATRRFKGFDSDDSDEGDTVTSSIPNSTQPAGRSQVVAPVSQGVSRVHSVPSTCGQPVGISPMGVVDDSDDGLFVKDGPADGVSQKRSQKQSQRKRPADIFMDNFLMEDIAPTAAEVKRRKVIAGAPLVKLEPPPSPESKVPSLPEVKFLVTTKKKAKAPIDVLEVARKSREAEEKKRRLEAQDLANLLEDLDMLAIRQGQPVKEMTLRQPREVRGGDKKEGQQEGWDPQWNGRRNFKRFRRKGERGGLRVVVSRVVVPIVQVEARGARADDDFFLQEGHLAGRAVEAPGDPDKENAGETQMSRRSRLGMTESRRMVNDSDEESDELPKIQEISGRKKGTIAAMAVGSGRAETGRKVSQKRGQEGEESQPPAKRRVVRQVVTIDDSDSEEEIRFKFGRRR